MITTNIIHRRDLEPLWHKANEVVLHYEKAGDCIAAVMGADQIAVNLSRRHPKAVTFCLLCKRYNLYASEMAPYEIPCSPMHCGAVERACRIGGSYVYKCPVGFSFWTSPFFAGKRFAGAFISSGIPVAGKQQILDRLFNVYRQEISRAEISRYLDDVPEKSGEDIDALARMLLLYAEHVSCSAESEPDFEGSRFENFQYDFMDMERRLVTNLRRGDYNEIRKASRDLLNGLFLACGGNLDHFKSKAIELVVILSRTGSTPENNDELARSSGRYLKHIEELETADEVTKNLFMIIERMAGKIFSFQGIRHASALRKAERFIRENFTRKISLKEIADVSGLSAPYFSTIFRDEMGENLSNYLNRLRVEKASAMLRETGFSVSKISSACGFEDQSWFSKIFKSYTGKSPCKFRENGDFELPVQGTAADRVCLG